MFMSKTVAAVVILAALSPLSAQARWQDTKQSPITAILVPPPPPPGMVAAAPSRQPGRTSGGMYTLQPVNPAPQYSAQEDWQTANASKP